MLRIFQSLAKSRKFVRRAFALAVAFSLFPLPSSLLYANELYDAVTVTGGSKVQMGEDILITFTDPATPGTLSFSKGSAAARVLVVGGGGGGGAVKANTYGAGAGGGGGGVIDKSMDRFKNSYTIFVGKGGTAATAFPSGPVPGGQGDPSRILNDDDAEIVCAKGGGGGGAGASSGGTGNGGSGGCGGGGSGTSSKPGNGGSGTTGQGYAGGSGKSSKYISGGGGGAGAKAADSESVSTPGGIGKLSDIRGLADDYFGGGGAGGDTRNTGGSGAIAGAKGGGGSGGTGDNKGSRDGENGRGGGGGGSAGTTSGAFQKPGLGGSGIVIIRLSNYQPGGVPIPKIKPITYDGEAHTPVKDTDLYTVSRDVTKTDVGNYVVTLTLTEAGRQLQWDDDQKTGDTRDVPWQIVKRKVEKPVLTKTETFVFDGTEQQGFVEADQLYTLTNNRQRNAGTYKVTATLVDPANNEWADGTSTAARSDLSWTIERLLLEAPTPFAASHVYDGTVQTGFVANVWYTYDDKNEQTNAGEYPVAVTLKEPANATWKGAAPTLKWEIKAQTVKKPVVTTSFTFDNTEKVACVQPEADIGKYTLSGEKGTNAGAYTVVAKLNNAGAVNYKWQNGDEKDLEIPWVIAVREIAWPPEGAEEEYPYEKGTVRKPIPESEWYERGGDLTGEIAKSYLTTATLKFNELPLLTNVVWKLSDGTISAGMKMWGWKIVAQKVPIPTPKSFTYEEQPRGTPKKQLALEIPDDAPYHWGGGDNLEQSVAGDYDCWLELNDPGNTVWEDGTSAAQTLDWTIDKADNEVLSLSVPDWQVGDTTPRNPSSLLKFGSAEPSWYSWGASEEGPWTPWDWARRSVPTEAGTYYLKIEAPEKDNWRATSAVTNFCVWVNPSEVFTDFVDITLSGAAGKDKTVAITIGPAQKQADGAVTGGLPGFEYMRTGLGGSEIRFVQTNATDSIRDVLLPYKLVNWNPSGESTIHVKVADLAEPIRMYWHAKDGDPKSANHPEEVTEAPVAATAAFSLVSRDGQFVDYWTEIPSISKAVWNVEEPPTEADVKHGALKTGTVATYYLTMPVGTTNDVIQTAPGTYVIVFARAGNDPAYTIFEGEQRKEYEVVWHNTYEDLGGTLGGRILLGNNDTMPDHEITGQAYWQTDSTLPSYWEHTTEPAKIALSNLGIGINHTLYQKTATGREVLWRLVNMRLGSLYLNSGTPAAARNYLPWSETCQPRTKGATMAPKEVSYLVMLNMGGLKYAETPAIYSPCYTNGLGTVYFDVVNGWTNDENAQLIVEVAVQTSRGEVPTDENCANPNDPDDPFYYLSHDEKGQPLTEEDDMWLPLKPTVLYKAKGATEFADMGSPTDNIIRPAVKTGGGNTEFYRVLAANTYTNSFVRFRIRRPVASDIHDDADAAYLILLDNVHASPPAMRADLTALGVSDATKDRTGKQTLGMAGALSTAFPAQTDEGVIGRATISYKTTAGIDCDKTKFIASARFNYRWRYLNQSFGKWQTAYLDHTKLTGEDGGILPTVTPLDFTGRTGDIEWFYDMTLQAPAYKYVNYSGDGVEKPVMDLNEEVRSVTNRQSVAGTVRQASGGTDWFVRLRDGKSDWEGFHVEIRSVDKDAKPIAGDYAMELVGDNMWRAMVAIPTNAFGKCAFSFYGVNLHEGGDPDRVTTAYRPYGVDGAGETPVDIPTSGRIVPDGLGAQPFTIDKAAGYLEFRLSDSYLTYQVGRAEYQDFNNWNDAHTPKGGKFRADSTDTNSVDVAGMTKVDADVASWAPFKAVDDLWNEDFHLPNYSPPPGDPFEKEVFHTSHETPTVGWSAQNITFVSERFVSSEVVEQQDRSGMAGKLRGSGAGKIDFTGSTAAATGLERPEGLEKVTLNARLGQSYSFSSMAYDSSKDNEDNYMFFVPVTMSHKTKNSDETPTDMAVGASTSVVGYYYPGFGCYEFRVERLTKGVKGHVDDPRVRLSVYKWYADGEDHWLNERLAYRDFAVPAWTEEKTGSTWNPEAERQYFGLFVSLKTEYKDEVAQDEPTKTTIVAGLSEGHAAIKSGDYYFLTPWKNFEGITYKGLVVEDKDEPWGWGAYGVAAKDCPAQFIVPAYQDEPFDEETVATTANPKDDKDKDGEGGWYFDQVIESLGDGLKDIRNDIFKKRNGWVLQDRYECFTNTLVSVGGTRIGNWYGLRTPTNITQTIDLYLKPKGRSESQWRKYGSQVVSSYGFSALPAFDLKLPGSWDLRLATGAGSTADVVVDDIMQYRWTAADINDPGKITSDDRDSIFVFSQGIVQTNKTSKWITLQPARAVPTRPVSVRGPILNGLGKFTFSYNNADANAEVWVQVATNLVENLSGQGGYNDSIISKDLGEQQEIGEWLTYAKYSAKATDAEHKLKVGDLGASDSKTVYVGWHNHADRPIKGLFRLFVPPATVIAATNAAVKVGNVDYGRIDVTAASCTDEPGISPRSWRAWNMRTIGDPDDSEQRMNLVDMLISSDGGQGLVAALNNSTSNVEDNKGTAVDPTDKRLASGYPAIYSPTMHPLKPTSGVGSVSVKARLYSTNGATETSGGGRITVWGSKDSRAERWTKLDVFEVTSSVFSNFTWTAGKEVYTAVKFELSDASAKTPKGDYDRVILDEIVIGEKVPPTINFLYARPFRMNLFSEEPIDDILSPAEQPLAGESWGVQTKLALQQLTDEIDVERGFEVYLSYFRGMVPWGYGNWCSNRSAVVNIPLRQVGDASNLVFRSVGDRPESLVGPSDKVGEIVQFMLTVKYWDRGGRDDTLTLPVDWRQPDWFYPLEKNLENGALDDDRNFSAYTVLDTMSPGRAWINEVSWNDGPAGQNAGRVPTENQYVEICVPVGIDLTDWYLRVTDLNLNSKVFARFGDKANGIPATKAPTANCTNGYEFLVLKAPNAKVPEADANWYGVTLGDNVKNGTLNYGNPYQFELLRPSGVIEHQFVLEGTNQFRIYGSFNIYDGTNLVHNLDINDELKIPFVKSPKRFFAGADVARRTGDKFASVGVVGGEDGPDTADWPGGSNTWVEAMAFTPGRINAGQVIPKGWFIAPNGTNSWVYFSLESDHIRQSIGGETNQTVMAVVPQGRTTNVLYTVDGWYEGEIFENDVRKESGRAGSFTWAVTPTGSMYYVAAKAAPQAKLAERFGLTGENPYTPAVLKWLAKWKADGMADDIRLARFKGLHSFDSWSFMDLTDMYWLDIPPVPETPEEWAHNDGTNWWFRGGIDDFSGTDHIIHRKEYRGGELKDITYTNRQITVTLYASNEVTQAVWSPDHLQGLNNESSKGGYGNSWTSVTFKVKGRLDLSAKSPYLPFRTFIFGDGSFDENHQAVIDILDPFQSSIGIAYGWDKHPNSSAYFQWRIDTTYYPYSIEKLKADSTYKDVE